MKKNIFFLLVSLVVAALCGVSSQGQASEGSVSSVPTTVPLSPQSSPPASQVEEPVAVRKDTPAAKIEILDKKEKKKMSQREKAEDKARTEALENAVEQQVEAMRDERAKEMPYLDRIYIRTSITPLKIQQKDEFLRGGAKDLQDLILRAQAVHTQSKAAHENISLYNRRVLMALRKLFPEVLFNFNDREGVLSGSPFTGDDWHVTLKQPIFNGGILWNTLLQEKANLEAAKKNYDKTLAELVFDLSRAYFEYQRTLQTAEEHRIAVDKMKRFAEMSEEKFREKIISEIEQLNVQSLYSQMQFDLESANQDFELAKIEIQKYLDLSVNDQLTLAKVYDLNEVVEGQAIPAGSAIGVKTVPDVFKGQGKAPEMSKLIDLSYGHRPELQVEAAKLQAMRLGERIRWGEFLPKANLTYQFGALGEAYTRAVDMGPGYKHTPELKKEWQLMLEMNWNLGGNKASYTFSRDQKAPSITQFEQLGGTYLRRNGLTFGVLDGLDAFVNVKQAEVDKLNQVVELEKAEKQVLQDVKQAYYDYQKAMIQVNSTVKRLEYRKRLREFAEYRLSKKEIELSEYLQAESDLVREKAELHKALKDYFTARASLNHAVGIQDFLSMETPQKK
ncbi:MAG: TolC family protein [Candidatus Omnitrophota bacterium]